MTAKTKADQLSKTELAVLKRIFDVLLAAPGSCLHTRHDGFVYVQEDGPQPIAIEQLLKHFGSRTDLADLAAGAYLDRVDRAKSKLFSDAGDALEHAYRIAIAFPLSPAVADRLLTTMAKMGWYGRLESVAMKVAKRQLKKTEVIALFDSYIADKGSSSSSARKTLEELAQRYLSLAERLEQMRRLEIFEREFAESD